MRDGILAQDILSYRFSPPPPPPPLAQWRGAGACLPAFWDPTSLSSSSWRRSRRLGRPSS
eukprot:11124934-Heterocapsa_arctica.AAC.1